MLCSVCTADAQDTIVIRRAHFGTQHEIFLADSSWLFHAGDIAGAEKPTLPTGQWSPLHFTPFGTKNKPPGWQGMGWFRLWVRVDSSLLGTKISLRINHDGASELFVDGKPVGGYGKVGHSSLEMEARRAPGELIPLWFNDSSAHLIAIRYSNYYGVYSDFLGFQTWLGDFSARSKLIVRSRELFDFAPLCAAAEIILGLLHIFLFLFYPRQRLNLYFALFVLFVGVNGFGRYFYYQTGSPSFQYFADFLTQECKVIMMTSAVMILYALDYGRIPRWRLFSMGSISAVFLIFYFIKYYALRNPAMADYFSVIFSICIIDGFWSAWHLIMKKQKDIWLIVTGVVSIILVYFFAWADSFNLWTYELNAVRMFVMSTGELILPFCLSLYLALDFARTNQNLTARLAEVERLSEQTIAQEAEKRSSLAAEAKRLEDLVQQRTIELRKQAHELREMDTVKSRFFTNITHEFKTPLTLIINPAKELMADPAGANASKYIRLILNNASRVLRLINQLLDLSKLENGLMEVTLEPLDLVALVRIHVRSYESLVMQKEIGLNFINPPDELWILSDRDKLDKIILNIFSNAIKFTDRGQVDVFLQNESGAEGASFHLIVRDSGRGIPSSKLPFIFSRFYQADPSDTRSAEGTGIGLSVAKELVELMGGEIHARSEEGMFTEMHIRIPYQAAEAMADPSYATDTRLEHLRSEDDFIPLVTDEEKPLILIIEDHEELRDFIRQTLANNYRILTAADGNIGIEMGMKHIPNLIITDLMMPGVDGYQVSRTFKTDEKTSHVPIIILTAKTDVISRVQGIETGADAYLGKPFDKRELIAQIENLIQVRNQLREHYGRRDLWLNNTPAMPSMEQEFITRVKAAVESHLDDERYSADQLARDMGLSRAQLHRKLKALIGQAPGELIRIVRLQYAHDLLQRRVATVAEVAYMVGFSNPASFSTSFSRHFGFPPRDVAVL